MQLPDVNALNYAHRQDAPEHDRYAAWPRALVEAPEPFAVAQVVLAGFLQIVTNPKIFSAASLGMLPQARRVVRRRIACEFGDVFLFCWRPSSLLAVEQG